MCSSRISKVLASFIIIFVVVLSTSSCYDRSYPINKAEAVVETSSSNEWERVTEEIYQLDRHIIDTSLHIVTDRMKVNGGWIYRSYTYTVDTNDFSTNQVYVPDSN